MLELTVEERVLVDKCMSKVGCEKPRQCLLLPAAEFQRVVGLGAEQGQRAWKLLCQLAYPWKERLQSASQLGAEQWITTGDKRMDAVLGGGVRLGSIVEVVGESGSGKTQLCLQLAVLAQLTAANTTVVYVSTEGAFPTQRLASMIGSLAQQRSEVCDVESVMQRIQVAELSDMETMFHALYHKVPALLSTGHVRLVVVDSIAANLRFDMDGAGGSYRSAKDFYRERSAHLVQMGARFKRWAVQYNCAFVCVNQVKDVFSELTQRPVPPPSDGSVASLSGEDGDGFVGAQRSQKAPALGPVWANIINARVMLYQRRGLSLLPPGQAPEGQLADAGCPPPGFLRTRRWFENAMSPWAPRACCEVVLGDAGFQHVP
ncbi:DNA repair protein rhp57 [Coemansia sp. RSA 552]|nr:DNA repair protein rhp57 [Coemansia sp. RSA 552]